MIIFFKIKISFDLNLYTSTQTEFADSGNEENRRRILIYLIYFPKYGLN